jgi:pilus assembly protein CpaB
MAARRYTVVFTTALAVAGVATYAVYRVLDDTRRAAHPATQPVVVASQDIQEGERLDPRNVRLDEWPAATVPAGAYAGLDSIAGRVARMAVFKGELILPGRLAPTGTGPGLEVKIARGRRAMAVKINDVVGLAGLIQPNSRVDVLVTLKEDGSTERQHAKLFMENVRVLSVGTQVERGEDGRAINATTAALEVTPEQAERLAVAMNQGSIQLVLRGYGDPDSVNTPGANSLDVFAQLRTVRYEPPAPAAPAPRPARRVVRADPPPAPPPAPRVAVAPTPRRDSVVVEVYHGTKREEKKFSDSTAHTTGDP